MNDLFLKIINMSVSASWLVLAVLILRLVLKKAPKWINVLLWGIVAVRLICPFAIESPVSLIPDSVYYDAAIGAGREPISDGEGGYYVVTKHDQLGEPSTIENTVIPVLSVVWLTGIAALLVYTAVSYWRLRRKVDTAVLYKDNIFQSENVVSPFVLGIIKPRIYLPFKLDGQDLEHVVAHEQAHICRKDHWWKPLGFLLLTIHWFNPLMWIAYVLLCRDIELACDEKVIKELGNKQRADYTQALVACSVNRRMIAACPLAFGEVGVKERVKSVMNYKKPAFWIVVVAAVSCIVVAVCFLTNPLTSDDSITLIEQSTPGNGNAFTYSVNFGQNVMSGTVHAEQWSNGTCVKSSPVVLTNAVDEISVLMDVRRENGASVGVDIQIETNEYSGSLITYFAFPENHSITGWACNGYELNETIQIQPKSEKILAAMVFDEGNGVRVFSPEVLISEPERLENADYAIVIRAAFDDTNIGTQNTENTLSYSALNAKVLEVHEDYLLVEPVEGSWELSSADRIEVPIRNAYPSPEPQVGDTIEIEYSGRILETYPAQIEDVHGIRVVEEAEQWDLIPMVMIDGTLYLDTGHESTVEGRCGVMDGEITSSIDGGMPTKDNQSNFGTGYGYQYGPTEGTIEIYMNDKWWVFATEEVRQEIQFPSKQTDTKENTFDTAINKAILAHYASDEPDVLIWVPVKKRITADDEVTYNELR